MEAIGNKFKKLALQHKIRINLTKLFIAAFLGLYGFSVGKFVSSIYLFLRIGSIEYSWGLLWIVLDLIFLIYCRIRFQDHKFDRKHLPTADPKLVTRIIYELKEKRSTECPKKFLEGWCFDQPIENLTKLDVFEWIAGMLYQTPYNDLDPETYSLVAGHVEELEQILEFEFPEKNKSNPKINLTIDKMEFFFRPLIFYAGTRLFSFLTRVTLRAYKFRYADLGSIVMYERKGSIDQPPLIFFHGFGIGIWPYIHFIHSLISRFPERTVILYEFKCLGMRFEMNHILPRTYSNIIASTLKERGISQVTAIGHSFGTACICWMDQFHPNLIKSRVFIDPICFSLWTHHIAKNFIYRSPDKLKLYFFKYIALLEPGIHIYLRRYFVWFQNTYFSDNLPSNSLIYLAENDDIVHSSYVEKYLGKFPNQTRKFEMIPGVSHGGFFIRSDYSQLHDEISILDAIKK